MAKGPPPADHAAVKLMVEYLSLPAKKGRGQTPLPGEGEVGERNEPGEGLPLETQKKVYFRLLLPENVL